MQNIWKHRESTFKYDLDNKNIIRKDITRKMVDGLIHPVVKSTSGLVTELTRLFDKEDAHGEER